MNGPLETGDMLVVTVSVPTTDSTQLAATVEHGVVRIFGPDGFRRNVPLPRARRHARSPSRR